MNSSPDNFDSLQEIIRLKRYEQPPPRYFNEFSGRVVSRIQAGEGRVSWWERFGVDLRPAFAAGAGIVACALVVYGVATTEGTDALDGTGLPAAANISAAPTVDHPLTAMPGASLAASSTNPVPSYGTPIDRRGSDPRVTPVNFLR